MKYSVLVLSTFLLFSEVRAEAIKDDVQVLTRIKEVLWPKAYREQNAELLDAILHSSFQMIDTEGVRSNKSDELEYVRTQKWEVKNFRYHIQRLDVYESKFAVIDGRGETDNYSYMSSNYFVKENGEWRAIGSHVSGLKRSER